MLIVQHKNYNTIKSSLAFQFVSDEPECACSQSVKRFTAHLVC